MSIISIFLLFQVINLINSNIIIPFRRFMSIIKEQNYSLDLEYVNQRVDNPYKAEINLGDPSQRIPGFLKTDEFAFYLSNHECPHSTIYFKSGSNNFTYITPEEYFDDDHITNYQFSDALFLQKLNSSNVSDTFNLSDYVYTKIGDYMLSSDNNMKGQQCFHIGTQVSLKGEEKRTNLVESLYEKGEIESQLFEFKIINDDEMCLVLGLELEEEERSQYKFVNSITIEDSAFFNYKKLGLKFANINLNNYGTSYNRETNAEFDISLGCLIGSTDFNEYFKIFLKDNNISVEPKLLEQEYYVYFFSKELEKIDIIKNFAITFYNKELNYNFTFDFNDLFLEKRFGYYFLIAFEKEFRSTWKIGYPFFKKYKFIFDQESKSVGFYCPDGCIDGGNSQIKENSFNYKKFFIIFGIIIGAIIILIIGIFIGKKIFEVRKRRANELLEVYEYKEDENNKIIDNTEKA